MSICRAAGAGVETGFTCAAINRRSALRRSARPRDHHAAPLRPARPVRPLRCGERIGVHRGDRRARSDRRRAGPGQRRHVGRHQHLNRPATQLAPARGRARPARARPRLPRRRIRAPSSAACMMPTAVARAAEHDGARAFRGSQHVDHRAPAGRCVDQVRDVLDVAVGRAGRGARGLAGSTCTVSRWPPRQRLDRAAAASPRATGATLGWRRLRAATPDPRESPGPASRRPRPGSPPRTARERQRLAAQQVDQPARACRSPGPARATAPEIAADRRAAGERGRSGGRPRRSSQASSRRTWDAELAGRHHHQRARVPAAPGGLPRRGGPRRQGPEGDGLARAGLRRDQQVRARAGGAKQTPAWDGSVVSSRGAARSASSARRDESEARRFFTGGQAELHPCRVPVLDNVGSMVRVGAGCLSSGATTSMCRGAAPATMFFAHGFGCDQNMWRLLAPVYAERYRTVALRSRRQRHLRSVRVRSRPSTRRCRLRRRRARDRQRVRRRTGRLRRAFGQRHDRHARQSEAARAVRGPPDDRPVSLLHQRWRLRRRLHRVGHRVAAGDAGEQLSGLVEQHGAGHHGRARSTASWPSS